MSRFKKVLDDIEKYVIVTVFSILLVSMMFQVILRYVFSFAIGWMEQICRLMFVIVIFFGISQGSKNGAHLRVSAVAELCKNKKLGQIVYITGDLIGILFTGFLVYQLTFYTIEVAQKGQVFAGAPWCPVWVMYAVGVLGLAGFIIRTLQHQTLKRFRDLKSIVPGKNQSQK